MQTLKDQLSAVIISVRKKMDSGLIQIGSMQHRWAEIKLENTKDQ